MNQEILTIAEYAQLRGISEKTVRRGVKAGKIPSTTVQGKFGPEYRIFHTQPGEDKANNGDGQNVQGSPSLVEAIMKLTDQIRDLSFLVGELRAKNEVLERKLLSMSTRKRKKKPWYKRITGRK